MCVTSAGVNGAFKEHHESWVLGKRVQRSTILNKDLSTKLNEVA